MTAKAAVRAGPGHPVWDALNDRETLERVAACIRARVAARTIPIARREAEVEAVLSTVCERALRRINGFDGTKGTAAHWLIGIVLKVLAERLPAASCQSAVVQDVPLDETEVLDRLAAAELGTRLPEVDRRVLLLVAQGMTGAEIAQELGITPGAARFRLHRARKWARQMLSPDILGEARHE